MPARCLPWILTPLLFSCASTEEGPKSALDGAQDRMRVEAYDRAALRENVTTGLYLAQLDRSIQMWNQIFLSGNKATDGRKLKILSESIRHRTGKLFHEVVAELESGPPINRRIAAAALGFVPSENSLSPLLNALTDLDDEVVANALFGLAKLGDPDTPTASLAHLIEFGSTPVIRSNASLATLEVMRMDGDGSDMVRHAARKGLTDQDPGVRTHCALILARVLDFTSIEDLTLQLREDPVPSAAMAAGRAIAYMGSKEDRQMGRVARVLTAALSHVDGRVKQSLLLDLRTFAERNYAKDEDWVTWAHRLPVESF
ncbi:MAG: HEAT repeat domain-containing protein [Planctomycetota bacterium]|nr:HEAT repeat domain-containing protein [Planctomycetota bacterium]